MDKKITSLFVSVLAGLVVGVLGGVLVLQALGSGGPGPDRAGSLEIERPVGEVSGTAALTELDAGSGRYLATPAEVLLQEEVRQAVKEALGEGRRTAIVNATERVMASVVTVFVTEKIQRSRIDDFFGDFFFGTPKPQQGLGSGVIISSEGYILTNDHVVGNADVITIRLADGREFEGVVSDTDPRSDLAILKIDPPDDLPVVEMGDSSDLLIGEWVIALGSPFGFYLQDPQPSVSVGVVSAVGRSFVTSSQGRLRYFPSTIQTDAAINPGNSGGPLVNALGEVIGINSFILSQNGGSVGIGFAIPINQVKEALDQIRTYGHIRSAWTGLQTDDNNWYYVRTYGIRNEKGILVVDIERDSPAAQAGLSNGDLIIGVNGQEMRRNEEFETLLLKAEIDDRIEIEYYPHRENRKRDTVLIVGELPRGGQ